MKYNILYIVFLISVIVYAIFVNRIYIENMDNNNNNEIVNIFLLCFNEEILLEKTVHHYKKYLPNCYITIYDNKSTDNSINIAKTLDCNVISWESNDEINENKFIDIKNNCWKNVKGWVIVADMDEWLCVSNEDLKNENIMGTTILKTQGYNMIGESNSVRLNDINLHDINKAVKYDRESKNICFNSSHINEISYSIGAHDCNPTGNVKFSKKIYTLKHMEKLGLPFLTDKLKARYKRNISNIKNGTGIQYTDNLNKITEYYMNDFNNSILINI
jgi:hypothetical protein